MKAEIMCGDRSPFAIKTRKIYRYIFAQIWKKYCYHGFLIKI